MEQPLGETVRAHFDRQDYLRTHDDAALLAGHFVLAPEVVQEQVGLPGAEDPEHVVLRQHRGMRRATKVDTVGAGFAGVCDGTLSAGRILDAIAQLLGEDPVAAAGPYPGAIRLLVEQGFLEPVAGARAGDPAAMTADASYGLRVAKARAGFPAGCAWWPAAFTLFGAALLLWTGARLLHRAPGSTPRGRWWPSRS